MVRHETYLTPEGFKQLKQELDTLKNVRRQELATRIHKASGTGGSIDNAGYDEAKNEQAFNEGRIRELENILNNAVVPAARPRKSGIVVLGSSVTVVPPDGPKRVYKVVGSAEADPLEGKISNESPVGQVLLGRKVGDQVKAETPSGVITFSITRIR